MVSGAQSPQNAKKPAPAAPKEVPAPNAPQSTHFPILLLAFGDAPSWDVRVGPKGPELLERQGYPPIVLEPGEIARDGAADVWNYRAKDMATGADLTVHLSREACTQGASATKYTFHALVTHSQIGTLQGCARIAAELFPRLPGQSASPDDDDDSDKKKPPSIPPITNSKSPVAVAFLNATGKIVVSRNGVRKIAASAGSQLALSRDGKRLLYTREDSKSSPSNTIVLYDFDSARSRDLVRGNVSQAFWSPDDTRIAYLSVGDHGSQVWVATPDAPERAAVFSSQLVTSLQGWVDGHTVLACDSQSAYWISEDRPVNSLSLREIYGQTFEPKPLDTLSLNPVNADLLLVSAAYTSAPAGAPTDATGAVSGMFLYELRSKRRVTLSPADQFARHGEWSRDGLQVFYTRRSAPSTFGIFRIFWDGSGLRRYSDGTDLVIGQ